MAKNKKYILVLKSTSTAAHTDTSLNIQYVAPIVTVPPSPYPVSVNFGSPTVVTINNIKSVVFISDVKLPFFNVPKTNINFRKVVSTVDVVIKSDLGCPNASNVSAQQDNKDITEIYIYI